ncbi:MAG: class I SAM-dependent methyltransferase [Bacteroidales bacterium]|nr:class I SAM-dependent methyltransferase [Bacteroidales bacterium]
MEKPYKHIAKYYDLLIPDLWYCKWYKFAEKVLRRKKINPSLIVDAGCGTGRLTNLLASLGPAIGFDRSAEMLKIARKKYPHIKFIKKSFLDFCLPDEKRADLIVCAFDSLNYTSTVAELRQIFKNFYNQIREEGCLLFDLNGEKAFAWNKKLIKNTRTFKFDSTIVIWNNYFYPRHWKAIFEIQKPTKKGTAVVFTEQHEEFYYSPKTILKILSETGFSHFQVYGDTAFHRPSLKNKRYFFVAQK